jgi:hypothetical protein
VPSEAQRTASEDESDNLHSGGTPGGAPEAPAGPPQQGTGNPIKTNDYNSVQYWKSKCLDLETAHNQTLELLQSLQAEINRLKEREAIFEEQLKALTETDDSTQQVREWKTEMKKVIAKTAAPSQTVAKPEGTSYAAITKKKSNTKQLKRNAQRLTRPVGPPIEFSKIHYKLNDSRPLKKCNSSREVNALLRAHIKAVDINNDTFAISKIGNSVLEIIVPKNKRNLIRGKLEENNLEVLADFTNSGNPAYVNPNFKETMIRRLTNQLKYARLANVKKCIRSGVPAEILAEVDAILNQSEAVKETASVGSMELEESQ